MSGDKWVVCPGTRCKPAKPESQVVTKERYGWMWDDDGSHYIVDRETGARIDVQADLLTDQEAVELICNSLNSFDASKVEGVLISRKCAKTLESLAALALHELKQSRWVSQADRDAKDELSTALLKSKE